MSPHYKPNPSLSDREIEVLLLVANGYSVPQISKMLFITEHTVKNHKQRIREHLCANNMAHAVALAFLEGILVERIEMPSLW